MNDKREKERERERVIERRRVTEEDRSRETAHFKGFQTPFSHPLVSFVLI